MNSQAGENPGCGGNPTGPNCPGSGGQTYGTCFQPTLTGTLGSASLMLELGQVPNGLPRRGQPSIQARIYIMQPLAGTTYGTTCKAANPFSTSAVVIAQSDALTLCYSGGGCFCGGCVGVGQNFQVVTWSFSGGNQVIIAGAQTYVIALWFECNNPLGCVYDDNNSFNAGVDTTSGYAGGAVGCRRCMVADPWNTGPFGRSTFDDTVAIGRGLSVPFIVYGTSGGSVNPPPTSCQGGNCGTVVNTNSTSNLKWNNSLTLFYIGNSPFDGFIVNATTYLGKTYIGTLFLGIYLVNQGCVTANGPFSVQCPGILMSETEYINPQGPSKVVMITSVQVKAGQTFGVAVSGSANGLVINDTNTGTVMYQTSFTMPTVIQQFSIFSSSSKVALFAGLFAGASPPSTGNGGSTSIGDDLIGLVDFFGMGRLAGGLLVLLIFFLAITVGIAFATAHLNRAPGGSPRPGFPPVGFLLIFLFLVFIFSAPIGTGGVSVLPPWVTIFVMAVFAWLFTEGILRRGGRF